MRLSDLIAEFIRKEIELEGGAAELQRAELASRFKCVPSQINYVLGSRFTPELGYIVETRRGGGGFIRIERRTMSGRELLMHIINTVGDSLDAGSCRMMLKNILAAGVISIKEEALISAACAPTATVLPEGAGDALRAELLKKMLLVLC